MREFFKGWRRKLGVLTLVIALSLTGMWGRSIVIFYGDGLSVTPFDEVYFFIGIRQHRLATYGSHIIWTGYNPDARTGQTWDVTFPAIIIPLTLLSAYLLLSTPRKPVPKMSVEPTTAEAT